MAYKVIILYQLYMPSYFLGTFTEYPHFNFFCIGFSRRDDGRNSGFPKERYSDFDKNW